MRGSWRGLLCVVLALALTAVVSAREPASDAPNDASTRMPLTLPAAFPATLDAFALHGLEDWKVPGFAVAVVHEGRVVYRRGFGERKLGGDDSDPVDADTLFGIMSTTKAMTSMALAMLVDEGKVAWDDPVSKHLPWFALGDSYATRAVTVRDLLRHNAGVPNADWLWVRGDLDTRQIIERLRELPPAYSLRDGFIYQNVMYQVAGEIVAKAAGMPWHRFIELRIFKPLDMTRSFATLTAMQSAKPHNVSTPHFEIEQRVRAIVDVPVDSIPAAGSVWSTANDMAKWMTFLLDGGRIDDRALVKPDTFRELFESQAIVPPGEFYPTLALTRPHFTTYGLGWFLQDYRGEFVAMHTGSMDGRTAIVGLLPDRRFGIVVLGNLDHAEFRHALMWHAFDVALGGGTRDWSAELLTLYGDAKRKGTTARATAVAERVSGTRPSKSIESYAGIYEHPVWGDVVIEVHGQQLSLRVGTAAEARGPMQHWHYDTFEVTPGDGRAGTWPATFGLDAAGKVASLTLFGEDSYRFVRKAEISH